MVQKRDSGRMPWLNYQTVTNRRWHNDDVVLMGDAAHTTHFSIGSGTRLAIEDAIALAGRLQEHEHLQAALEAYGEERRSALLLPARRARDSARWFENVTRYIDLEAPSSERCWLAATDSLACRPVCLPVRTTGCTRWPEVRGPAEAAEPAELGTPAQPSSRWVRVAVAWAVGLIAM